MTFTEILRKGPYRSLNARKRQPGCFRDVWPLRKKTVGGGQRYYRSYSENTMGKKPVGVLLSMAFFIKMSQ
jgi:hypothetical protein